MLCWQSGVVVHDDDRSDLQTRDDIELLVREFYRDAAVDDLLGPIFDAAQIDWPAHIERITDFWAWQLLGQKGYGRNPLKAHQPVHDRTPFAASHYGRWVELFVNTVDEHFVGPVAETAKGRAVKMANALARLMDGHSGAGSVPTEVAVMHTRPGHRA